LNSSEFAQRGHSRSDHPNDKAPTVAGLYRRNSEWLARQNLPQDTGQKPAGRLAFPELTVDRIPAASQRGEHGNHDSPKHPEFVAAFRQRPYVADLKMSAQVHRHQQIHRSEQGNGAREESQSESNGGNQFDRSRECDLRGGQQNAQAGKIGV
jgi:hypothetical protein